MNIMIFTSKKWRGFTMMLALIAATIVTLPATAGSVTGTYTLYLNSTDGTLRQNYASGTNVTSVMNTAGAVVGGTSSARTLTLTDFSFTTSAATALEVPAGTTIVLNGTNTVTSTYNGTVSSCGINATGKIIINGSGSLIATGGNSTGNSNGIASDGDIAINGNATVTAVGRTTATTSYGIWIDSGVLTISGGAVTATGGTRAIRNGGASSYN